MFRIKLKSKRRSQWTKMFIITKVPEKPVIDQDLKAFILNIKSNLNPYKSVSFTVCNYNNKTITNNRKSNSDSLVSSFD